MYRISKNYAEIVPPFTTNQPVLPSPTCDRQYPPQATASLPSPARPTGGEGDHFHAGRQFARGFPDEMAEVTRVAEQMVADRGSEPRGRSLAQLALASPLASLVRSKSQVGTARRSRVD